MKIFLKYSPNFSDLPDDHPRITGVHEQYEPGEGITATCTSWHSNPPANLSWFINGEPVSIFLNKISTAAVSKTFIAKLFIFIVY